MKRLGITLALSLAAFLVGFLFVVILVYGYWYVDSWEYNHAPRESLSDPHDAAAMLLFALEMLFGLPGGILTGLGCAFIVLVWRLTRHHTG
jgi:hypothetical protein